jgi:hypothetical protein
MDLQDQEKQGISSKVGGLWLQSDSWSQFQQELCSCCVNDVIFRIMLIAKLIRDLQASIVDVETAFLDGDLQVDIYMSIPEGMNQDTNTCLLFRKAIYVLVQSA